MAKLKTKEQKDRDTDRRLFKTYGFTLAEREIMLEEQGRVCAICGSDGGTRSLHVDHDHKAKYLKVETVKRPELHGWYASTIYRGKVVDYLAPTKSEAIRGVRVKLKRLSIRALICWPCNRTLRSGNDKPEVFERMAQYLRQFNGDKPTT